MGLHGQQLAQRGVAHVERPALGGYQAEAIVEAGVEYGRGQGLLFAERAHTLGRHWDALALRQRDSICALPFECKRIHNVVAIAADE